jgi:hypothetical protein
MKGDHHMQMPVEVELLDTVTRNCWPEVGDAQPARLETCLWASMPPAR